MLTLTKKENMSKQQLRVLMPVEVLRLSEVADIDTIEKSLNQFVRNQYDEVNFEILDSWKLTFSINSRATNGIGVFKRSLKYPSDHEFVISISIGIPDESQAQYGHEGVRDSYFSELTAARFHILDPMFDHYQSMNEYIFESSKRAIICSLSSKITINGKKLTMSN